MTRDRFNPDRPVEGEVDPDRLAKMIKRVNALLDFANDTHATSDEEKQVKLAQAAALMTRYQITEAMLADETPGATREGVGHEAFAVDGTGGFGTHRAAALASVAIAMGGESCWQGRNSDKRLTLHVTAHEGILAAIRVIFTSMVPVMEAGARVAGATARDAQPWNRQARYHAYRSYLEGFGRGVAARIYREQRANPVGGAELVLVRREREVKDAFTSRHRLVSDRRAPRLDWEAFKRGQRDGDAFGAPRVDAPATQALG